MKPLVKVRIKSKDDKRWPGYIFWGRMRTSTAALIVVFFALFWVYETFQPAPQPEPPATQMVPPGFVPDPDYTWVPRTQVQQRTTTTTTTTETTETTTETTEPTDTTTEVPSPLTPTTTPSPGTVIDPDGSGPLPPQTVTTPPALTPTVPGGAPTSPTTPVSPR